MVLQEFIEPADHDFRKVLKIENANRIFLVCGKSFLNQKLYNEIILNLSFKITIFTDFEINPKYESVLRGIKAYKESNSDFIIAAGGGSAIDVAKCIRCYNKCNTQTIDALCPALLAIPTTAGSGSESTEFAAIYVDGIKHSISDSSNLPKYVCLDSELLDTLPLNQRKFTMLDALCHSIEAFWSVNSTDESKNYSKRAIKTILENYKGYIENNQKSNSSMLEASNFAGRAINIAKTTACHAMSYILTSHYGTSHGFAASLFIPSVWDFINKHCADRCSDVRGNEYLSSTMKELELLITPSRFTEIVNGLGLQRPKLKNETPYDLALKVNEDRLKNTPVLMYQEDIEKIYTDVLK